MTISIISPVFNSADTVKILVDEVIKYTTLITTDFEFLLVDDGSKDSSWPEIENICLANPLIKGIKLTRNYGQHQAIRIGLECAKGEWVIVMDCDLQDDPAEIPRLFQKTRDGFKIILAKRMNRKDSFLKRITSFLFWKLLSLLSKTKIDPLVGNFGVYHTDVIAAFLSLKPTEKYFSIAMQKFVFKRTTLEVQHQLRLNKNSSYSFIKLFTHAFYVFIDTWGLPIMRSSKVLPPDNSIKVLKTIN